MNNHQHRRLDKSIISLTQRIDGLNSGYKENSKYWKGREIISSQKWLKITKANTISRREDYNVKEGLRYFPDDYIKWMFPLGVPKDLEEEANKWYSDYIELMEYRKNSILGKEKCDGCLLSTDKEEDAIYFGINKIMAKGLEDNNNNNSADQPLYPCKIQNRFECPYEKEKRKPDVKLDVNDLFALDDIADLVERALSRAESMTESNDTVYEANFETYRVKEIRLNYYGNPYSSSIDYPLEEKLAEVEKLSIVPIRSAQDIYHALTDRETLDKVLEQGLDKDNLNHKDYLLDFFMTIKDKVRIEDLFITPNYHTYDSNSQQQYSKCSLCQGFANIYCVNCNNIWLCTNQGFEF